MDNALVIPVSYLAYWLAKNDLEHQLVTMHSRPFFETDTSSPQMRNLRAIPIGIAIAGQGSLSLVVPALSSGGLNSQLLHVPLRLFFHRLFFFHLFPIRQVTAKVVPAAYLLPKAYLWLGVDVIPEPACRGQFPTV